MNSYSAQTDHIDIFAQPAALDIFDTSNSVQTVDIFGTSSETLDIFATEDSHLDIFDTTETQQIDIFNLSQADPVSIWSNEVNSQPVGNTTDPLTVKFDTLIQALDSEDLRGISTVVQSAKNLYTNGL